MKNNKKMLLGIVLISLILVSILFLNNDKNIKSKKKIQKKDEYVMNVTSSLDMLYDYSNTKLIYEHSKYVAIIKVSKIEGASNYNNIIGEYVNPYTYGTAKVIKVYKGTLDKDIIKFSRIGGKITYEQMLKGDSSPEKLLKLKNESKYKDVDNSKLYVEYTILKDIKIEEGKTYLVYIHDDSSVIKGAYGIFGLQYGLREVKDNNTLVKNNDTNKWEKLSDIME